MSATAQGQDPAPVPARVRSKPAKAVALKVANGNGHAVVKTEDVISGFAGQILELARDPNFDASKVTALWEVNRQYLERQDKEREHEAKLAAYADKAKAQSEFPIIGRDAWNDQTKSHYARLETIWEICCPIWTKYGFGVDFPSIRTPEGLIQLSCHITHTSGWETTVTMPEAPSDNVGFKGTANKTVVQGNQSTISYLKRGLLCSAMGIVTAMEDDDGNSGVRKQEAAQRRQELDHQAAPANPARERAATNNRRDRPPADWVQVTYDALGATTTPVAWKGMLAGALGQAPSATEVLALAKKLKAYVDKIPDKRNRDEVGRMFRAAMDLFGGEKSDKSDKSSDTAASDKPSDAADAKPKLTEDEQWAEDQISDLSGIWGMDTFMVMANDPKTQARMKRLSASGPENRVLFERIKAAYEARHTFIAKEAVR